MNIAIYNIGKDKRINYSFDKCMLEAMAYELEGNFHPEVLKTYAIIIRTYLMRKMRLFDGKGCSLYPRIDLCNNPDHCIGLSPVENIPKDKIKRLLKAIDNTQNKIITFQGKIIFPYHHHSCGGATENSEKVLGNTIQYARRVLCDHCKSTSPHWQTSVEFTLEELEKRFNIFFPKASPLEGLSIEKVLYNVERDREGRIRNIKVGNKLIKGQEFREKLGLLSTRFGWQPTSIKFFVQGKGHGIGLCKYGAQGLALKGKDGEEILKYYFTGIRIENISQWSIKVPLRDKIILIDAGHGGKEEGVKRNNIIEKDANLKITLSLKELLEDAGAKVALTRKDDRYVTLQERLDLSNNIKPHFILSIHGSDSSELLNTTQVYIYPGDRGGEELGKHILKQFKGIGLNCKDIIEADLYLTRESKKNSLELDIGYFNLEGDQFIDNIAKAIYKAFLNYWWIE